VLQQNTCTALNKNQRNRERGKERGLSAGREGTAHRTEPTRMEQGLERREGGPRSGSRTGIGTWKEDNTDQNQPKRNRDLREGRGPCSGSRTGAGTWKEDNSDQNLRGGFLRGGLSTAGEKGGDHARVQRRRTLETFGKTRRKDEIQKG
jgi:hypothetical protein